MTPHHSSTPPVGPDATPPIVSARFHASGRVQGVGFRPFIYRLALRHGLAGSVWNHTGGVTVEVWGPSRSLDAFQGAVPSELPPLARLEGWRREDASLPSPAPPDFRIVASAESADRTARRVAPDTAPCPDCLRELGTASDRRFRHPLINCTNCGPRYTLVNDLPYDRGRTSMAGFPMCPACQAEYGDPADRRFHAQPVCCPECGPRLSFLRVGDDAPWTGSDDEALAAATALLDAGGILALKGVGGYHLAADAGRPDAVSELRRRKGRDAKPFAVMVADGAGAAALVQLTDAGRALLESPAAPIVLAPLREGEAGTAVALAEVAPDLDRLGVMLPSSPLHHLLLQELSRPLVMTSGNRTDDPLARDDDAALADLGHIADGFLGHERPIVRAVDDSVWLDRRGDAPVVLRRARGAVPEPVQLPGAVSGEGLCMGADLKGALALVRSGGQVILSQHLGDLDHLEAFHRAETTAGDLLRLYDARPAWVAVDAHPGYRSHRMGRDLAGKLAAGREPLPVVEVQHHHAHLASLLVEHDQVGPVVGIVADGVGYGADGSAWGGEILVGDLLEVERAGHLRPLRLPGGDAAARETGRCALSWMVDALGVEAAGAHPLAREVIRDDARRAGILALLERDLRSPPSTGLGRLFDAAASLLGVCPENRYEAESGQRLEALARRSGARPGGAGVIPEVAPTRRLEDGNHEAGTGSSSPFELDHRPLLISLLQRVQKGYLTSDLAWFFHDAVADALARGALRATREAGLGIVGLSGGVFCNELLSGQVQRKLEAHGLQVLRHQQVPPNDGGIALGQAAVASARGRLTTG